MSETVELEIVAIDLATSVIDKVAGSLQNGLKNAALAVGAAFVAGIGASVAILGDLTDKAGEAELSMTRFESLVGGSSLAGFKKEMLGFADALSQVTRFEDENILEAEAMLATYDTIGQEIFPQVLNATLDLAEFMKTDATGAAQTLGRAFADIEGGSLSLIKKQKLVTDEQVEMAEAMAAAGDEAGAMALIIEALDDKIGKLAEDMGQTFEGQKTIFLNNLNNISEGLGDMLLDTLTPLVTKLDDLALKYAPMVAEAFDKYIVPALNNVVETFGKLFTLLQAGDFQGIFDVLLEDFSSLSDTLSKAIDKIDWGAVGTSIADGIRDIDWQGNSEKFTASIKKLGAALEKAAKEFPWADVGGAIGDAIMSSIAGAMTVNGKQADWQEIKDQMQANVEAFPGWAEIGEYIAGAISNGIKPSEITFDPSVWVTAFDEIKMAAKKAMAGIQDSFTSSGITGSLTTWINTTLVPGIETALKNIKKAFYNAFQGAMQQAITALTDMKTSVIKAVQKFIDAVKGVIGKGISLAVSVSVPSLASFAKMAATLAAGMAMLQAAMGGGGGGAGGGKKATPRSNSSSFNTAGPLGGGFAEGTGGWQTVPTGFPNDSFPAMLSSGEKFAVIPKGGQVPQGSNAGGMGGNLILNLTYAPAFSTSDKSELMSNLVPMLDEWYRRRLAS